MMSQIYNKAQFPLNLVFKYFLFGIALNYYILKHCTLTFVKILPVSSSTKKTQNTKFVSGMQRYLHLKNQKVNYNTATLQSFLLFKINILCDNIQYDEQL